MANLETMFANMGAKTSWNPDGEMLRGYFFTDPKEEKLQSIAQRLAERGCRVVDLYRTDDRSTYFLHVERVERHTPATLDARNQAFNALAEEFGFESCDGMDVGPMPRACRGI